MRGELLSAESRDLLYGFMKLDSYDNYRLEAGLPEDVPFIQKTGTQLERACHVGVIEPQDERRAIVVVACAEGPTKARKPAACSNRSAVRSARRC